MKKLFAIMTLLTFVALTGCQTATSNSTTAATLPSSVAQTYASSASTFANSMCGSMAGWAGAGSIGGFSVRGASTGGKTITGPTNGWYHVTQTSSYGAYSYDYDMYAKLTPATGTPTSVDIYGTVTISMGSTTYTLAYGSATAPFSGTVSYTGSVVTNVTINGSIVMTVTTPNAAQTGNDTFVLTVSTTSLSVPIGTGAYPNGTVTVGLKYNGAAQPDMTVTFNSTATATWAYNGQSGSFTVVAASVK